MPLLKKIERHSKIDQRIRAVRGAPPRWWQLGERYGDCSNPHPHPHPHTLTLATTRYGDWSRARRIDKFKATLNGVSSKLLGSSRRNKP